MTPLALIRHGPTAWTALGRLQGRTDMPLSADGRADVMRWRLPADWVGWDGVTSPMSRARETATILFGRAVPVERALIEMAWGDWEGETDQTLRPRYGLSFDRPEMAGLDFAPPGGETPRQVQERLQPWLRSFAQRRRPTVAIVHKGIIRALLGLATGWDFQGKPPVRLDWRRGHLFTVDAAGKPHLDRMNVALSP
jgi:probable phosphoglycerate mutase